MNNNCLYFSICCLNQNSTYYAMLYYALKTLDNLYDESFDVRVYYTFPDFKKYKYLEEYSIYNEFKNRFILIESTYDKKYTIETDPNGVNTPWMSKWHNLENVFKYDYDKIFLIDSDVIFYKNPNYIFNKYDNKKIYGYGLWDDTATQVCPTLSPMGSGQLLIPKKFHKDANNFYKDVVKERIRLNKAAKKLLNKKEITLDKYNNFTFFNEQYCGQNILTKNSKDFGDLEVEDFTTPSRSNLESDNTVYDVSVKNNDIVIDNIKTCIVHYSAGHSCFMLPKYLRNNELIECAKNWKLKINKINNPNKYWQNLFVKDPSEVVGDVVETRAIVFALFLDDYNDNNMKYYCMLYYALETLYKTSYKTEKQFDIVVYYNKQKNDLKSTKVFEGDENLFLDFPDVNFIEFDFNRETNSDVFFFKWNTMDHLFANFDYDKVFVIDSDIIFTKNPAYMFNKYNRNDCAYVIGEGSDETIKKVLGGNGINGGQIILPSKIYHEKIKDFSNKIKIERKKLLKKAKEVLNEKDYKWFDHLSDQYSMLMVLNNSGVELDDIHGPDIIYGSGASEISLDENDVLSFYTKASILHYLAYFGFMMVPDRLKTKWMKERYKEEVNTKTIPVNRIMRLE